MGNQGIESSAFQRNLEEALRHSTPDIRPSEAHERNLRLILDHNFHHHRRRARGVIAALVIAVALLGTTQVRNLGSIDFEMVQVGIESDGSAVVIPSAGNLAGGPGYGQGVPDHMGPVLTHEDLEYLAMRYENIVAEDYEILEFRGWTIKGESLFLIQFDVETDGRVETNTTAIGNFENDTVLQLWPFIEEFEDFHMDLIATGQATNLGQAILRVENHRVLFTKWAHFYPEYGEVVHWIGSPLE